MSQLKLAPPDAILHALVCCAAIGGHDAAVLERFCACPALAPHAGRLAQVSPLARDMLDADEGLAAHLTLLEQSLNGAGDAARQLYALCADFIAYAGEVSAEELRYLDRLRAHLDLSRLDCAALDLAARVRYQNLTSDS